MEVNTWNCNVKTYFMVKTIRTEVHLKKHRFSGKWINLLNRQKVIQHEKSAETTPGR